MDPNEDHEDDEIIEIPDEDIAEVIDLSDEFQTPNNGDNNGTTSDDEHMDEEGEEIVEDIETDQSSVIFKGHTGEIFVVDIGSKDLAATGGEDDRAYVWNYKSGDLIFECKNHTDSVTCLKFNAKKSLLATADMAGLIQIWKVEDWSKLQQFQTGDLKWLCWHQTADILFAGDSDGLVWMWLVSTDNCKVYSGHGPSCSSGCLFPDGKRLCAGYEDGTVKIWDLKEANFITVHGISCHTEPITCFDCSSDNNLAASGSEDGKVNIFHASNGKIIDSIVCAKREQKSSNMEDGQDQGSSISIESLAFSPISHLLAIGTVLGDLQLWDLNSSQVRQNLTHPDGVVKSLWIEQCLVTCCLDGKMRVWDSRSGSIVRQWKAHKKEIFDFALTSNNDYVITVSADQTCKVFPLNDFMDK